VGVRERVNCVVSVTHNYPWVVLTLPLSYCRTVSTTVSVGVREGVWV